MEALPVLREAIIPIRAENWISGSRSRARPNKWIKGLRV